MQTKQLRAHQIDHLAHYIAHEKCADLSDPGTGKTGSACVYMWYLWAHQQTKTIWMMPKSLLKKNYHEMLAFTDFEPDEVVIVDGTKKQIEKILQNKKAKVFLMGFQRFATDWKDIKKIHPELGGIVIDEHHMGGFKNPKSNRCTELYAAMRQFKYFLTLSGTLISGRLDSCYSAIHIIEPRYYASHASFLAQHAVTDEWGSVLFWKNHDKIGRILLRHCVRKTFVEVYGEQAKEIQFELVEMDTKSRKAYEEFEEKALLELEDSFLDAPNNAVAVMRCRQIMSHPHTFGILSEKEITGKDESLMVHLEDHLNSKEPLIIFASLQPEQERILKIVKSMGLRADLINSTVTTRRAKIDEDFRAGKLDVIVCSPGTASVGFNWGHVNHIIFVSVDYDNTNFTQAYKRTIRGVRTTPLLITVLEYENSIDSKMFKIIDKKSEDLNKVDSSYEVLTLSKGNKESS